MNTIEKANAAKRLKDNADFKALMKSIEDDIFESFRNVKIGDTETLANVHALSHGFRLVNARLDKYIEFAIFEKSRDLEE